MKKICYFLRGLLSDLNLYALLKNKTTLHLTLMQQGVFLLKDSGTKRQTFDCLTWHGDSRCFDNDLTHYNAQLEKLLANVKQNSGTFCALSLPDNLCTIHTIEMPMMTDDEINYHASFDAVKFWQPFCLELSANNDTHQLAHQSISHDSVAHTMVVLLAVADKKPLKQILTCLQRHQIITTTITVNHCAIWHYFRQEKPLTKVPCFVTLDGWHATLHYCAKKNHTLIALNQLATDNIACADGGKKLDTFDWLLSQINTLIRDENSPIKSFDRIDLIANNLDDDSADKVRQNDQNYLPFTIAKPILMTSGQSRQYGLEALLGLASLPADTRADSQQVILNFSALLFKNKGRTAIINRFAVALRRVSLFVFALYLLFLTPTFWAVFFNSPVSAPDDDKKHQAMITRINHQQKQVLRIKQLLQAENSYQQFAHNLVELVPLGVAVTGLAYHSDQASVHLNVLANDSKLTNKLIDALLKEPYVLDVVLGKSVQNNNTSASTLTIGLKKTNQQ